MLSVSWFEYPTEIIWWQVGLYYLAVAWGSFVVGCCGVGGGVVFMPLMLLLPGVTPTVASATVFCGAAPMAIARCAHLGYLGLLKVGPALPLMLGAVVGAFLGQFALPYLPHAGVSFFAAGVTLAAGAQTTWKAARERRKGAQDAAAPAAVDVEASQHVPPAAEQLALERTGGGGKSMLSLEALPTTALERTLKTASYLCLGAVASFFSSITGTGGPLFLFPLWLFLDPAVSMRQLVAISAPFAFTMVVCSAVGGMVFSHADLGMAAIMALVGCVGVLAGGLFMVRIGDSSLKVVVGAMLILIGVGVATRTVFDVVS